MTHLVADRQRILEELQRYEQLIASMLDGIEPVEPAHDYAAAVQLDRLRPLAMREHDPQRASVAVERLVELGLSPRLGQMVVVDAAGHHRPVYRPLLVYTWLAAYRAMYETLSTSNFGRWEEGLRGWCDLLEAELTGILWSAGPIPASQGDRIAEATWCALALHIAGKVFIRDAWTDLASATFGSLARSQTTSGAFLSTSAIDNPEPAWFHELSILHAAASYAVQAEDRPLAAAVQRATMFHLHETQPDHATSQPWGIFAFIWNPATHPLADQMLHALQLQQPQQRDSVSLLLLNDALYCLRLFLK
jgi:hypothetical protein